MRTRIACRTWALMVQVEMYSMPPDGGRVAVPVACARPAGSGARCRSVPGCLGLGGKHLRHACMRACRQLSGYMKSYTMYRSTLQPAPWRARGVLDPLGSHAHVNAHTFSPRVDLQNLACGERAPRTSSTRREHVTAARFHEIGRREDTRHRPSDDCRQDCATATAAPTCRSGPYQHARSRTVAPDAYRS